MEENDGHDDTFHSMPPDTSFENGVEHPDLVGEVNLSTSETDLNPYQTDGEVSIAVNVDYYGIDTRVRGSDNGEGSVVEGILENITISTPDPGDESEIDDVILPPPLGGRLLHPVPTADSVSSLTEGNNHAAERGSDNNGDQVCKIREIGV